MLASAGQISMLQPETALPDADVLDQHRARP